MKRQYGGQKARSTASRLCLRFFRLVPSVMVSLGLPLGTASCTRAPEKPPESALKQAKRDSRLDQPEDEEFERRNLAPPPAYGNKVVMAQSELSGTGRF